MRRTDLVDQPTSAPTRKVKGAGLVGALVAVGLAVLEGAGVDVPGVDGSALAAAVPGALATLGAIIGGYWTRDRA